MNTDAPRASTPDRPIDHRNLDVDQFNLDVAFGRAGGKILWQPRILSWYTDKRFMGEDLPAPYTGMSVPQFYLALGCSNRIYEYYEAFKWEEDPQVRFSRRELAADRYELRWDTPVGSQTAVYRVSKNSTWHEPLKWPISDENDMKVAAFEIGRETARMVLEIIPGHSVESVTVPCEMVLRESAVRARDGCKRCCRNQKTQIAGGC